MTFASDPSLFVHQLDYSDDRLLLLRVSEDDLRAASFLDQRLLQAEPGQPQRAMQWYDWSAVASQTDATGAPARDDARFIFHIGHVGSTLLSRLLGEASDTLSLREPFLLRQLVELDHMEGLAHSPWPAGRVAERIPLVRKWLSRTFRPGQRALIKATSFVSALASPLLGDSHKAVFLTLRPERYLQTILAGSGARQDLKMLSSQRLERLNRQLGEDAFQLWELDEAQRAAMAWACEMAALEAASGKNVLWQDFDAFLADPAASLVRIAAHLEIGLSEAQARAWVKGPIMTRYSKAPEQGYSPQLREKLLASAAKERKEDIRAALRWLDEAGRAHPALASALERA